MKSRGNGRSRRPAPGGFDRRRDKKDSDSKPSFRKREDGEDSSERKSPRKDFKGERSFEKKSFSKRPYSRDAGEGRSKSYGDAGERKPYERKSNRDASDRKPYERKPYGDSAERRPYERKSFEKKPYTRSGDGDRKRSYGDSREGGDKRKWNRKEDHEFYGERKPGRQSGGRYNRSFSQKLSGKKPQRSQQEPKEDDGLIRLNKFIANAGICSRREADELIELGAITVNGEIVTTLGYKVGPTDIVKYNNEPLKGEKNVYLLLNKPKDFITTVEDPQDRKTVMWLIKDKCKERIYPVGRLDRNTTGVLLFTNDGELAKKLTHPSYEVEKIYQVTLDKSLKPDDLEKIEKGIHLEDGFIKPDVVSYTGPDKSVIGIEIHSGRNRIVRRIFEQFGYDVIKLDRVVFAGLTKKDLPRGRSRFLTQLEVANLKMMAGKKKKTVSQATNN
jgi:23S rRNA pseudouridine2605 synthase